MGFDGRTPLAYRIGACLLGFGGWVVLSLEGTVLDLPPLWLRHLSRGGERIGFGAAPVLGWVGRISGRNHFMVGGVAPFPTVDPRRVDGGLNASTRLRGSGS